MNLHLEAAEAALFSGEVEQMDRWTKLVRQESKDVLDQIKAYEVMIDASNVKGQPHEAVLIARQALKLLNVTFPEQPDQSDIGQALQETKQLLAEKRIEDLIDLPEDSDPSRRAIMNLLSKAGYAAYLSAPTLYPLTVLERVRLSIKFGNTSSSPYAYAVYGGILCGIVGDIDSGF